ncbi:MAG: endonuclease MutS2 [Cytophagales bacterium]|nr:endonuclease MutS2 [Bernardetiaceae bacterium]MDW8203720.1 endonuclease MutS2 [Cytophagales bacterium]
MLYPKNFEEKIGFDKIRQQLADLCNGSLGRAFVQRMRFNERYEIVHKLQSQTEEFRKLLDAGQTFPEGNFLDPSESFQKAAIEGAFLNEEEFFNLKLSLGTLLNCLEIIAKKPATEIPHLKALSGNLTVDKSLLAEIEQVIDERGQVRDGASPALRDIRSSILREQANARKKIDHILRTLKAEGLASDEAQLTIREGRMVIPLPVEHKRRLKGFVHDTSASGQTVFIEPAEVLEINNEIRELMAEERREIVRILTRLTARLRPHLDELKKGYFFLGLIDFIRAKARFAARFKAIFPELSPQPRLQWVAARHPLLQQHLEETSRNIVPLTIRLDEQNRILLISGPNAGGKSVCLKTVGLLQYMLQCGIPIPVQEGSRAGIFQHLFIDIGDEQSIDNDLSTYSSHLKNMKAFLQWADDQSLCLIDEFGTGTEPQLGGAIAEAILEQLNERRIYGVITTHYANLKFFAEHTPGIINGAMRYHVEALEPLFELEIGKPGSSFALEIAQKIGLPRAVVQSARQKVGKDKIDIEKLLKELEIEKQFYKQQNEALQAEKQLLAKTQAEYAHLRDFIETNRKQLINEAKAEAKRLLQQANQKIENTIREIREHQAEKEKTRQLRQELEEFGEQLQPEEIKTISTTIPPVHSEIELENTPIQIGDYVRLKGTNTVGEVVAIKGKEASVMIGELKSNLKVHRLEKISRRSYRQLVPEKAAPASNVGVDINEKMSQFSFDLDVRGKRAEEALIEVSRFIDDAIMLSHQNLRIIHGKGDGILRTLIREHLRKHKEVLRLEDEHADRGGAGITLVTLR